MKKTDKFLQAHSKTGEEYDDDAEFNIKIQQQGIYEISFQAIMYCNVGDECVEAEDFLSVSTNNRATKQTLAEFKITDFDQQNKWELKEIPNILIDSLDDFSVV